MPKLKELALERIRGEVKSCDAIEETFSKFTSRLVCKHFPTAHRSPNDLY